MDRATPKVCTYRCERAVATLKPVRKVSRYTRSGDRRAGRDVRGALVLYQPDGKVPSMSNARINILESSLAVLRDPEGASLSFQSVADATGISKPGLMYHFPTKDALIRGVLDHVVTSWEERLLKFLDGPLEASTPEQRMSAYVEGALSSELDRADLAVFFDAHYRSELYEIWDSRMGGWTHLPNSLNAADRARLHIARLAADGYWFATASGTQSGDPDEIANAIRSLLRGN